MKKRIFLSIAFLLCAIIPFSTHAAEFKSSEQSYTLDEGEQVDDDLFIASQQVTIDGDINGDLFAAASSIEINGNINGSVFLAASNVIINGDIEDDIFIGASNVSISGTSNDNVYIGAGTISTKKTFSSAKDLILGAGSADINGQIGKNLVMGAGTATINGTIDESAYLSVGDDKKAASDTNSPQLFIGEDAKIGGNLEYKSTAPAKIERGAAIGGKTDFKKLEKGTVHSSRVDFGYNPFQNRILTRTMAWLGSFFWLSFFGAMMVLIFKDKLDRVNDNAKSSYGHTFGYGLLAVIVTPLILIACALTIIGIPVAIILGVVYAIVMYFAKVFAAYAVGKKILPKQSPYLFVVLGALLVSVATVLPFIGWVINIVVLLFGLGAFVSYWKISKKNSKSAPVKKNVKKPAKKKVAKTTKK